MLHLLGDALVIYGPNSDMGIDDQLSTHLAVDNFGVVKLLDFTAHVCYTGAYSLFVEIISSWGFVFLFAIRALIGLIDFDIIKD